MKYFLILLGFLFQIVSGNAQSVKHYKILLKDKGDQTISDVQLSEKSLKRRENQNIDLNFTDIPLYQAYLDQIEDLEFEIHRQSKWLNSLYIKTTADSLEILKALDFVKSAKPIEVYQKRAESISLSTVDHQSLPLPNLDYGFAKPQIVQIEGEELHNYGYQGQGITIAVLDAGFLNVDLHSGFKRAWEKNQITAGPDFVRGGGQTVNFKFSSHGQKVLSTMLAFQPGLYIGTAPKANYVLIRTEDTDSETLVEEYNWLNAAEYADSIGVDMINSSLGYTRFDDSTQNHSYESLDGNQTIITQAADLAAQKGILVVNSAGNSGASSWYYIGAPADADSILSVGAVDRDGVSAAFSSHGPTVDGRVKPNVVGHGQGVYVSKDSNSYHSRNGTSFSGPVICGMTACLWQFLKTKNESISNMEVIKLVEESSHLYPDFNADYGYGIPNYKSILPQDIDPIPLEDQFLGIYPNPFNESLNIYANYKIGDELILISPTGQILESKTIQSKQLFVSFNTYSLSHGIYFVKMIHKGKSNVYKVVK